MIIDILANSIAVRLLVAFICDTSEHYKKSNLCYLINAVKTAYKESRTKKALKEYVRKDAYFKYSVTYRIIWGISNVLSLFARFLNRCFIGAIKGSKNIRRFKAIKITGPSLMLVYGGFFVGVLTLSYLLCSLLILPIESINVPVTCGLMGVSVLCLLVGNIAEYAKYSVIYRIVMYFFED